VNGTTIEFDTEPAVALTIAGPTMPVGTVRVPAANPPDVTALVMLPRLVE